MVDQILIDMINYSNEERNIEFKGSIPWAGDSRLKVSKSILAMSNLQDGGWIVIGKQEQADRSYLLTGMTQQDYDTWDPDNVKAFLYEYSDPPVNMDIYRFEHEGKKYAVIRVKEFESEPIICKKENGEILHKGLMYVRSKGKPESIGVPTHVEMREIIDLAIDKGLVRYLERNDRVTREAGVAQAQGRNDSEQFKKQTEDLQ
jgi:predicted HTH transcriptional regulator